MKKIFKIIIMRNSTNVKGSDFKLMLNNKFWNNSTIIQTSMVGLKNLKNRWYANEIKQ